MIQIMRERIVRLLLLFVLAAAVTAGGAASAMFDDVSDRTTASAAESLRLMGVMEGYADGTFRPDSGLNRAQFCKMVVTLIGADKDLGRYTAMTVFPDVRPSHWAAAYINLAARGEKIIAGYADGSFHPERPVTLGQASAILLRLLGHKDEDIGGVWPAGHVALAASTGLLDGVGTNGGADLTRAQAARLFVNVLRAETASGAPFFSLSSETTLTSIDGGAGKMVTAAGTYDMERVQASSSLVGSRGQVVLKGEKALTFLSRETGRAVVGSTGAVIVGANGSTRGFDALTGDRSGYAIYKDGAPASVGDLRTNDVAVWSEETGAVLVCDTRVTAYYESCWPSPSAPASIEILGGTEFPVIASAVDDLAQARIGKAYTFLLTADGQVAGILENNAMGNALAVSGRPSDGETGSGLRLLCGGIEIPLSCAAPDASLGPVVRISSNADGKIVYSRLTNDVSGALDLRARKLGAVELSENVRAYDGTGASVSLDTLDRDQIPAYEITSSRIDWAGRVDLLVLNGDPSAIVWFGRAISRTERVAVADRNGREPDEKDWTPTYRGSQPTLAVECADATIGPLPNLIGDVSTGTWVAVKLDRTGSRYTDVRALQKLSNVSAASWIGKTAVSFGGRTYAVSEDVPCYNRDNGRWISLDQARSYADSADLYVYEGAVRAVEVHT